MQSSSQGRYGYPGYQGYPYVNPVVHDVPSLDAHAASRWAGLPRKPMQDGPSVMSPGSSSAGGSSSQASQSSGQEQQGSRYQGYPYVNPVYIDVSGSMSPGPSGGGGSSGNSSQGAQRPQTPGANTSDTVPPKKDIDANPVVYIDLPEAGSVVSRSIESPSDDEPEFVQNTIMYDPFENRRIDMPKDDERSEASSSEAGGSSSAYTQQQYQNSRPPIRPSTLNFGGASGSGTQPSASSSRQTSIPSFMSKESQVYGGTDGADGFPISPIPISEFPEPPPAYTEVDERSPSREPVREPPRVDTPRVEAPPPPRTQVIVNEAVNQMNSQTNSQMNNQVNSQMNNQVNSQMNNQMNSLMNRPTSIATAFRNAMPVSLPIIGLQHHDQKYLICHHCAARVHTIVHKEIGPMTHFIACLVFFVFLPFILIVYCADYFMYKNHYCPNCFKLIGYETPIIGQKVNYVT